MAKLPENKKAYKVILNNYERIVFKYNPNAIKHFRDKEGNILETVKNNGEGYAFSIKLINNSIIILDTKTQDFIINKLVLSGKIIELEQWKTEQENKKILEDMEKESDVIGKFETSNQE